MTNIKWQKVKENAIREFYNRAGGNYGETITNNHAAYALIASIAENFKQSPTKILREWIEIGCKIIENWDIRSAKKLITLFPSCTPKHCQTKQLTADYNAKGEWEIIFV